MFIKLMIRELKVLHLIINGKVIIFYLIIKLKNESYTFTPDF